eukprot:6492231-Amphidinium_carterae.3
MAVAYLEALGGQLWVTSSLRPTPALLQNASVLRHPISGRAEDGAWHIQWDRALRLEAASEGVTVLTAWVPLPAASHTAQHSSTRQVTPELFALALHVLQQLLLVAALDSLPLFWFNAVLPSHSPHERSKVWMPPHSKAVQQRLVWHQTMLYMCHELLRCGLHNLIANRLFLGFGERLSPLGVKQRSTGSKFSIACLLFCSELGVSSSKFSGEPLSFCSQLLSTEGPPSATSTSTSLGPMCSITGVWFRLEGVYCLR